MTTENTSSPNPLNENQLSKIILDAAFKVHTKTGPDLLVEGKVIVELKSLEQLARVHSKQVLTQLRLSDRRLGLLINFGEVHLKNGIERIVNGLPDEGPGFGRKLLSSLVSFLF